MIRRVVEWIMLRRTLCSARCVAALTLVLLTVIPLPGAAELIEVGPAVAELELERAAAEGQTEQQPQHDSIDSSNSRFLA